MKKLLQKVWDYYIAYAEMKASHYNKIHQHSRYI